MMLPLIVSEKPVDPTGSMVAEVKTSFPMPSRVPVHLTTSPVPVLVKLNELRTGKSVSNPEPPKLSHPPEKRSTTINVGLAETGGIKNWELANSVNS